MKSCDYGALQPSDQGVIPQFIHEASLWQYKFGASTIQSDHPP